MIIWMIEDSVDRTFVSDRRGVVRESKLRAKARGLPQRGYKLIVEEPTKANIVYFLNRQPSVISREIICEIGVAE